MAGEPILIVDDTPINLKLTRILLVNEEVSGVELKSGEFLEADYLISAVTPSALAWILPEPLRAELKTLPQLESSPIVSINLWLDRPVMNQDFVGLLGTRTQWAFNKNSILGASKDSQHIAVVISAAHGFVNWSKETLVDLALDELKQTLPKSQKAKLVHSTIVKEREATLSHTVPSDQLRPESRTSVANFSLAGDWINTGLPATIESAVMSGHEAAWHAQEFLHRRRAAS